MFGAVLLSFVAEFPERKLGGSFSGLKVGMARNQPLGLFAFIRAWYFGCRAGVAEWQTLRT